MTHRFRTGTAWHGPFLMAICALTAAACGLFEPREPEAPTQPSDAFRPATDPDAVIENLQRAIEAKDVVNYMQCFADPLRSSQPFVFVPSSGAAATFSIVFTRWTVDDERQYFQNMVARAAGKPNAGSGLTLTHKTVLTSGDSAVYSYDYTFTFEHADASIPQTAIGTMQLTLAPDKSNTWVIFRWVDYKTTSDITWSYFKGKFSN